MRHCRGMAAHLNASRAATLGSGDTTQLEREKLAEQAAAAAGISGLMLHLVSLCLKLKKI